MEPSVTAHCCATSAIEARRKPRPLTKWPILRPSCQAQIQTPSCVPRAALPKRGMNPQRNAQKETMRVARAATIAEKIAAVLFCAVVMGDIFWSLAVETSDYTF